MGTGIEETILLELTIAVEGKRERVRDEERGLKFFKTCMNTMQDVETGLENKKFGLWRSRKFWPSRASWPFSQCPEPISLFEPMGV